MGMGFLGVWEATVSCVLFVHFAKRAIPATLLPQLVAIRDWPPR